MQGLELKTAQAESDKLMRELASTFGVMTAYANVPTLALRKKYGLWEGRGSENIIRGYALGNILGLASIAVTATEAVSAIPLADAFVALNAAAYTLINSAGLIGYIVKRREERTISGTNTVENSIAK